MRADILALTFLNARLKAFKIWAHLAFIASMILMFFPFYLGIYSTYEQTCGLLCA